VWDWNYCKGDKYLCGTGTISREISICVGWNYFKGDKYLCGTGTISREIIICVGRGLRLFPYDLT